MTSEKETHGGADAQRHQGTSMELHSESREHIIRRPGKAPMNAEQAQDRRNTATSALTSTSPSIRYRRSSILAPRLGGSVAGEQRTERQRTDEPGANTSWGLWTLAAEPAKDAYAS